MERITDELLHELGDDFMYLEKMGIINKNITPFFLFVERYQNTMNKSLTTNCRKSVESCR